MNTGQRVILILICGAAAAFGFLAGKRSAPSALATGVVASMGQEAEKSTGSQHELSAPLELSALPASIATAVEKAAAQLSSDPLAALASLDSIEDELERSEATFALIGMMDAGHLGALMTAYGSMSVDEREALGVFVEPIGLVALCDRWAQLDPEAVIAVALSPLNSDTELMETAMLMRMIPLAFLAEHNHPDAFDVLEQLAGMLASANGGASASDIAVMANLIVGAGMAISDPVTSLRTMIERGIGAEEIAEADTIFDMAGPYAGQMLAEVMKLPEGEGRTEMLAQLYSSWATYDHSLAFASLADLPDGDDKSRLLDHALQYALENDPRGAAQYLGLIADPARRSSLTESLAKKWAETDPVEALEWARGLLPERNMIEFLRRASWQLPPDEAKAMIAAWSDQTREDYFENTGIAGTDHYVMRMLREDPGETIAWLEQNGGLRMLSGDEIATVVMEGGVESAIQFAATLAEGSMRDRYLRSVATEIGRSGRTELLGWAEAQGEKAHASAVASWAREDPTAAASYAAGQGTKLLGAAINDWSLEDPGAAFHWLADSKSGDPLAIGQVLSQSELASRWAQREPAAAATAIAQLPAEIAEAHLGTAIKNWAQAEPATASEYIVENFRSNSPLRDQAITSLIEAISDNSPVEAKAWAESIGDEAKKADALRFLEDR